MGYSSIHASAVERKKKLQRRHALIDDGTMETGGQAPQQHDAVLQMQKTIGNRAVINRLSEAPSDPLTFPVRRTVTKPVARMVIQRLPDVDEFIKKAGKPKKKSTRYRALLEALGDYKKFVDNTAIGKNPLSINKNIEMAMERLDQMSINLIPLTEKIKKEGTGFFFTSTKRKALLKMATDIQQERADLIKIRMKLTSGKNFGMGQLSIGQALASKDEGRVLELDSDKAVGKNRGGSSEVTEYSQGGIEGFFKANKEQFAYKNNEDYQNGLQQKSQAKGPIAKQLQIFALEEGTLELELKKLNQEELTLESNKQKAERHHFLVSERLRLTQQMTEISSQYTAKENEFNIGVEEAGINPHDTHMANRDIAMSLIDQLLGANLIAKAQFAIHKDPLSKKDVKGSFMEKAKGVQLSKMIDDNQFTGENVSLMQQLSRLHLLDLLCFQVDRNLSNIFVVFDENGNVTKMTGIDNDLSFGNRALSDEKVQALPAMSKYVDEDMALRILALKPDVLADLVKGLLTESEIKALMVRLEMLQEKLGMMKEQNLLLKPNNWNKAISEQLFVEKSSYFRNMGNQQNTKHGPKSLTKDKEKDK